MTLEVIHLCFLIIPSSVNYLSRHHVSENRKRTSPKDLVVPTPGSRGRPPRCPKGPQTTERGNSLKLTSFTDGSVRGPNPLLGERNADTH